MRRSAPAARPPERSRRPRGAPRPHPHIGRAGLVVPALGVVFGDIGTSPLYSVQTAFARDAIRPLAPDPSIVYGVISLVLWALVIVVTLQYVVLIMRADNDGEGGILSLVALLRRKGPGPTGRTLLVLTTLGMFGAALFFGDSMITPAISVLSAVEGLKVAQPSLASAVVPITLVIVVLLFLIQRAGTAVVGRLFGPVMALWFLVIAACGVRGIVQHPEALRALSPTYGISFLAHHGLAGFLALGAVVLAVTGAEALYADMGHFGAGPIRRAWIFLVFPALILNYLGQGALLLADRHSAENPFFVLVPSWGRLAMVILATAATVIASQAVISGAFSVTRQALQLGYLPHLRIRHTSNREEGQIYVPNVNWLLCFAVIALVVAFGSSARLASAYGVAVTGTITITMVLFLVTARTRWRVPLAPIVAGVLFFVVVDLAFLGANLAKVLHGGWLPLVIGAVIFVLLQTWEHGRELVTRRREHEEGPLREFIAGLRTREPPLVRLPGTAVFLNRGNTTTPLALRANVDHNHALHEHVVILSIETRPVPHVPPEERLETSDLGFRDDGISFVSAAFGYHDELDIPEILRQAAARGLETPLEIDEASYFLSKIQLVRTRAPGMAGWRKALFLATARVAADPVEYFRLPRERTVIMGSQIEV